MAITDILILKPSFGLEESVEFKNYVTESDQGHETADCAIDDGLREYKLRTEYLNKDDMDDLWDFYKARQGSYDDFLLKILTEFLIEDEPVGVGDGTTTQFVLHKFPVDTSDNHSATLDDVATVDYVLSNDTVNEISYITFNTAPALGVEIVATYEYYFRMRFKYDHFTRELFNHNLLSSGIELKEVRWNTYFPFQGNSSSSSSSSSAISVTTRWYGFHGLTNSFNTTTWDGSSLRQQYTLMRSQGSACGAQVTLNMNITRMMVYLDTPPGIGKKRVFTIYINDQPSDFRLTIAGLSKTGDYNGFLSCSEGDYIYIREDVYGAADSNVNIGFAVINNDSRRQPILGKGVAQYWSPILGGYLHGSANIFSSYPDGTLKFHSYFTSSGYLRNLQVRHFRYIGVGSIQDNTRIRKAVGSDLGASTELTTNLADLAIRDEDQEHSVRVNVGDALYFESTVSINDSRTVTMASLEFIPDNQKESVHCYSAGNQSPSSSEDRYSPLFFIHGFSAQNLATRKEAGTLFAIPGTIKNITIWMRNASIVAGHPCIFTIRKNEIDTDVIITLTNTANKVTSNGEIIVNVGDRLSVKWHRIGIVPSSSGDSFILAWTFESSNGGEWPMYMNVLTTA